MLVATYCIQSSSQRRSPCDCRTNDVYVSRRRDEVQSNNKLGRWVSLLAPALSDRTTEPVAFGSLRYANERGRRPQSDSAEKPTTELIFDIPVCWSAPLIIVQCTRHRVHASPQRQGAWLRSASLALCVLVVYSHSFAHTLARVSHQCADEMILWEHPCLGGRESSSFFAWSSEEKADESWQRTSARSGCHRDECTHSSLLHY